MHNATPPAVARDPRSVARGFFLPRRDGPSLPCTPLPTPTPYMPTPITGSDLIAAPRTWKNTHTHSPTPIAKKHPFAMTCSEADFTSKHLSSEVTKLLERPTQATSRSSAALSPGSRTTRRVKIPSVALRERPLPCLTSVTRYHRSAR